MSKLHSFAELIKKTWRFGPLIALGNVVLSFGRSVLPTGVLRRISDARNSSIQQYLDPIANKVLADYEPSRQPMQSDETVWVCWLQGEKDMPPIPSMCLASIIKNSGKRKVRLITLDNFADFVTIDDRIIKLYHAGKIKNCHFADILRVNLLSQRGGLWFDATLYCVSTIDERFFSRQFHTIHIAPYGHFVSQCRWAVYCLSAKPGNRLMALLERLFVEYLSRETLFVDYFLFDHFIDILYKKDSAIRELIDNVPISNPQIFGLSRILDKEFNPEDWNTLTNDTKIFKLNWKLHTPEYLESAGTNSYYHYLKNEVT